MPETIVNMSDAKMKSRVLNRMRLLRGKYRIEVTKYRPRRSDRQNRYYWPCFVAPFAEFLRDQGEHVTDEEAHEILKHKFLRKTTIAPTTGEELEYVRPTTTTLTTSEFNEYLDRCAHWLADMFGIEIPDSTDYHEREPQTAIPADNTLSGAGRSV